MSEQLPLFVPDSSWRPSAEFPDLSKEARVSIDTETKDPSIGAGLGPGVRRDGVLVGVSVAVPGWSRYYPIRHEGGDNLPEEQVLGWLRDFGKRFRGELCGANLSYDLDYLAENGVEFQAGSYLDCLHADCLLWEHHSSYSLDAISLRRLGEGKDERGLKEAAAAFGVDPKGGLWRLPARHVGPYAEKDAELPLRILKEQEPELRAQGLEEVWKLESELLPVLVAVRRRGVPVDLSKLDHIESLCKGKELAAWAELKRLTGYSLSPKDCWSSEAVAQALIAGGLSPERTPKTKKYSVSNEWLNSIDSPVTDAIKTARRYNKIYTTFVSSLRKHSIRGRIHCSYHQLRDSPGEGRVFGTVGGRMSCTDPNLQQQPIRDEELGPLWRSVFVPDEGALWTQADYSQQEPRRLIAYGEMMGLPGAKEAGDRFREDPKRDVYDEFARLAQVSRKSMKTIYLGLSYGMGEAKLSRSLGVEPIWVDGRERAGGVAQELLAAVHSRAPFIQKFSRAAQKTADKRGWVKTISGRRCRFRPLGEGMGFEDTRKAGNRIIQGSAADQTKRAMIDLHEAGYLPYLQVHDEVDLPTETEKDRVQVQEIMVEAYKSSVPSKVDIGFGNSWGECE